MGRIPWREGKVVSVETREGCFALGQMLHSPYIVFYSTFHNSIDWPEIDLADTPVLHFACVVRQFLSSSNAKYQKHIKPFKFKSYPTTWIKRDPSPIYRTIWTGTSDEMTVCYNGEKGASLIEEDITAIGTTAWENRKVLLKQINPTDSETIDNSELNGLESFPYQNERLYLCHLLGKNVDPMKDLILRRPLPKDYVTYMTLIRVPDDVLANLKPGCIEVDPPGLNP